MENALVSLYESNFLQRNVVEEKAGSADKGTAPDSGKSKKFKSKKKSMKKKGDNIGAITYDSHQRKETVFDRLLRETDELFGSAGGEEDIGDDNVFDAGAEDDGSEFGDEGGVDVITPEVIEALRGMTFGEIADLIAGGEDLGDEEDLFGDEEGDDFGFEDDMDDGDEIPTESAAFANGGDGNYKGDQGTYDGKAKRLPKTTHVKDNGDAKVGQTQDTGYDPDDTEGSEGAEHGAQGTYDGKAKRLPTTDHVKGNGDANFGKSKTGFKTNSGKKEKNYF